MLTKDQATKIKEQIYAQIEQANIPNKEEIKKEIAQMDEKALEEFLAQQNAAQQQGKCIFCSIADKEIPSFIINENPEALAVLEINPISLGHTIIIPKIHAKEMPKKAVELAKHIAEKLKVLAPKKIDILPSEMFGHDILNVLPIYANETLDSPRKKASDEELKTIYEKVKETKAEENLPEEQKQEKPKEKKPITDKDMWLPKRLP